MAEYVVAELAELEESERKIVRVGEIDIAVLLFRDEVLAFENRCLHQGGPVGEGMIINRVVADIDEEGRFRGERFDDDQLHLVCPWHGWEYALPGGECAVAPQMGLRRLPVDVRDDGRVVLSLAPAGSTAQPGGEV